MQSMSVEMNSGVVDRFKRIVEKKRLGHAYLFSGPHGSGKLATALEVACMLNCRESGPPCGECPSCRKILSGNHPDVHVITKGDERSIKIAQVVDVMGRTYLRPFEADYTVVVIDRADAMTPEASNALLKTLEEPSGHVVIMLLTAVEGRMLSTIRSRCQMVRFFSDGRDKAAAQLVKETAMSSSDAAWLTDLCEGVRPIAREKYDDGILSRRQEYLDAFVRGSLSEAFLKDILADKDRVKEVLDTLLLWFRDMALVKAGVASKRLANPKQFSELATLAKEYTHEHLRQVIEEIVQMQKNLNDNFNIKLPLLLLKETL